MADRSNHYERAFEAYLRSRRIATIAVDESRRACQDDFSLKSLDFIVPVQSGGFLLVDVKGRQLPRSRATRQNWATRDDIDSLITWRKGFGTDARALLVFVYQLAQESMATGFADAFRHEDRDYGCIGVDAFDYRERMRVRSPRWQTVNLTKADFDDLARPISNWLQGNHRSTS